MPKSNCEICNEGASIEKGNADFLWQTALNFGFKPGHYHISCLESMKPTNGEDHGHA